MTRIKICGITTQEDAALVNSLGIDYAGFVLFYPKSHRNIPLEKAETLVKALNDGIQSVAVVVSPTAEQAAAIERCGFDMLQVHGVLSDAVLNTVTIPVLKAFNGSDPAGQAESCSCNDKIAGYVFDAAEPGSGKTFDWESVKVLPRGGKLTILAGGLNAENVGKAIEYLAPDCVDVSSGVENEDGHGKNREKAEAFVRAVRKINQR